MKTKKSQGMILAVILVILVAVGVGAIVWMAAGGGAEPPTSQTVIQQTASEVAQATKSGDVSSIGVYVRGISNPTDINTKYAVPVYCEDSSGNMIIDGTSSSTTAEITGKTTIGEVINCYAFNASFQTVSQDPSTGNGQRYLNRKIESEVEHIVIDGFSVNIDTMDMDAYDDTLTALDEGATNNTAVGAGGTNSIEKITLKQNLTNTWYPLGGLYADVIEESNVSSISMEGNVVIKGNPDKTSSSISDGGPSTDVTTRKSKWDYVFEIDDDSSKEGKQALILEDNDWIEISPVTVGSNVGCTSGNNGGKITFYTFSKGFYRKSKSGGNIEYAHENDADSASVISADGYGVTVYCN